MQFSFLGASVPLKKTITWDPEAKDGHLEITSYPRHIRNFTSETIDKLDIRDLAKHIRCFGAQGWCLSKGVIQRKLKHESRAGSTNRTALTMWAVLDLDGVDGNLPDILQVMNLHQLDYVVQFSSKHKLEDPRKTYAHVFFALGYPANPNELKTWAMWLNLQFFHNQIQLNRTATALRWPIDITVNQNDKLIYIAPPEFKGLMDPVALRDRVYLHTGDQKYLDLTSTRVSYNDLREQASNLLDHLRRQGGLHKRNLTTIELGYDMEVIQSKTPMPNITVTGRKRDRGFTYYNLNNGDSWAYYHPDDDPEILRNFKGEPYLHLSVLDPEICKEAKELARALHKKAREENKPPPALGAPTQTPDNPSGTDYFACYEALTGRMKVGSYNWDTATLNLTPCAGVRRAQDWLREHGVLQIDQNLGIVPTFSVDYEPFNTDYFDPGKQKINLWRSPQVWQDLPDLDMNICPIAIRRLIVHAFGGEAEASYFTDWLAAYFQRKKRNTTAWVMQGVPGTGKGVLYDKVLKPLFGKGAIVARLRAFDSGFNGFMNEAELVLVDESDIDRKAGRDILADLNHYITDDTFQCEAKFHDPVQKKMNAMFLFTTNQPLPIRLDTGDRRFNVSAFQNEPIGMTDEWMEEIESEVPMFAQHLLHREIEENAHCKIFLNTAHADLRDMSQDCMGEAVLALKNGDLAFFVHNRPGGTDLMAAGKGSMLPMLDAHDALIAKAIQAATAHEGSGKEHRISRSELQALLFFTGDVNIDSPSKFTRTMNHRNFRLKPVVMDDKIVRRGCIVHWTIDEAAMDEWAASVHGDKFIGGPKLVKDDE